MFKSQKSNKATFPAGGRKAARFAALIESDSDDESDDEFGSDSEVADSEVAVEDPAPPELRMAVDGVTYTVRGDDVFTENGAFFGRLSEVNANKQALSISALINAASRGDVLWGDISDDDTIYPKKLTFNIFPKLSSYANIWDEPFADNLEMHRTDVYDTKALSDDEWAACMTWLFAKGWHIWCWDRDGFRADPDDLPPRVWTPADVEGEYVPEPDPEPVVYVRTYIPDPVPAPAPVPLIKKKKFHRFCNKAAACTRPDCAFEHGDSLVKLNEPCGYGASCTKRSTCVHVHPDETWSETLCIYRA